MKQATPNGKELATIAKNVEATLKAFVKKKREFQTMRAEALRINIDGLGDKEMIKAAALMRKKLKAARCEVQRQGKEMRQPLTNIAFMISEREKELVNIIEPSEQEMKRQEAWVESEVARIEAEAHAKEAERINERINRLAQFGYSVDTAVLAQLDDEVFAAVLEEARTQWQRENMNGDGTLKENQLAALHNQVDAIIADELAKQRGKECMLVNLEDYVASVNTMDAKLADRTRLTAFAQLVAMFMQEHMPEMQTEAGRDVMLTATELLRTVYKMLNEAVEQI